MPAADWQICENSALAVAATYKMFGRSRSSRVHEANNVKRVRQRFTRRPMYVMQEPTLY